MGTYTPWEWREMERDPVHDKRPPAMPTQSFDGWLREQLEEQDADDVAALVEQGWLEADAIAFVKENPREGGGNVS